MGFSILRMAAPLWNPSVYYKDQDANEIQGIEIHGSIMESCCAAVQFFCDHVCFKLQDFCNSLSETQSYLSVKLVRSLLVVWVPFSA